MKYFTAACLLLLASCTAPAFAKEEREIYFTGLGHVFSVGICTIGSGSCISHAWVENTISQVCKEKPASVSVVGHSLGASAAIVFVNAVTACGVKVKSAVFLDPMTHPKAFGIPKGVRTLTIYSVNFAGIGEGHADAEYYGGEHIGMAFDPYVLSRARKFMDRSK
jgi:hypothetical protein